MPKITLENKPDLTCQVKSSSAPKTVNYEGKKVTKPSIFSVFEKKILGIFKKIADLVYGFSAKKTHSEKNTFKNITNEPASTPVKTMVGNDKKLALQEVKKNGLYLENLSQFQDDESVVAAAVNNDGMALQFASPRLRNDFKTVLAAVIQNPGAFRFASDELRKNEVIIGATSHGKSHPKSPNPYAKFITEKETPVALSPLLDEETSAFNAVNQYGLSLKHYPNLQDNDKVVLAAVKQNGLALEFASERLRSDLNVVLEAIKQNKKAYKFASPDMRKNERVVETLS